MIVKRRIMSRSRILQIMFHDGDRRDLPQIEYRQKEQAAADMTAYLLADGNEVKIFHDQAMGGTVVEYDDGT